MRKPKVGESVIVHWVDSGLAQNGDPHEPNMGICERCETHGRVLSCEPSESLAKRLRKGMDATVLRVATNISGPRDKDVDVFAIWWPSVIKVEVWKR